MIEVERFLTEGLNVYTLLCRDLHLRYSWAYSAAAKDESCM